MPSGTSYWAGADRRAILQMHGNLVKRRCISPIWFKSAGGLERDATHQRLHCRVEDHSILQFVETNCVVAQGAGNGKLQAELGLQCILRAVVGHHGCVALADEGDHFFDLGRVNPRTLVEPQNGVYAALRSANNRVFFYVQPAGADVPIVITVNG